MKRIHLPTIGVVLLLLASLTLSPVSDLDAADIFTKITAGPGSGVGSSTGAAWGDYDNDGFIDLFVGQRGPGGNGSVSQLLYHNNGNGTFTRITSGAVAAVVTHCAGTVWGDFDNDGYLDLALMNKTVPNYLFHNNGDGSFTEKPALPFVSDAGDSRTVTWVDYDNDGYLDLFRTLGVVGNLDLPRRLYHNNRDETFTRITEGDFLTVRGGFFGVGWGDYNGDGQPDLFEPQANETSGLPSYLYRNDGASTFTRVLAGTIDGTANANAATWGDFDNDGDLDLFVSCAWPPGPVFGRPNLFYRNNGDGTLTSLTSLPANDTENQGGASTGCTWGDYDNDGWPDLFVANRFGQNNFLYHNNGNGTFTKVVGSVAVSDGGDSWATAWGDYDNDGFLDLFVGNFDAANFLYHNNGNDNHWIKFHLVGTRSNRDAIGAKVWVSATINGESLWQMREISGGDGTMGQNSLHVHFGLGDAAYVDFVFIQWPSGTLQDLGELPAQQFHTITEPGGEPRLEASRQNGHVQLTLTGKQGSRYAIETSAALPNWESANLTVTITNQNGATSLRAPVGNGIQAFYRAVWQ
jgi:enediyne biosynthesis protein E4